MSENKKRVVLVSASPKVDQDWAVSAFLAKHGETILEDERITVESIMVRSTLLHHQTEQAFESLQSADAIVIIFPLYFFCMPAMLTRFLQDFAAKYPSCKNPSSVYAIVNCGFPEPEINQEAMRVIEQFSIQTGRSCGGGVMIGGGGMVIAAKDAPFMRPIFEQIDGLLARVKQNAISDQQAESRIASVAPKFPKFLYFIGGNAGWKSMARKNHLRPKELYRKPYNL